MSALAVATVASLTVNLFVAWRITVPLWLMTQASKRIDAGHYAGCFAVAPLHSTDALEQLASSINTLAVALEPCSLLLEVSLHAPSNHIAVFFT